MLHCRIKRTRADVCLWHLTDISSRANDVSLSLQSGHHGCAGLHPMPACRSVAVTLAPTLDSAFTVSLIAATGVAKLPYVAVDEPLRLENTVGADAPKVGFGNAPVGSSTV